MLSYLPRYLQRFARFLTIIALCFGMCTISYAAASQDKSAADSDAGTKTTFPDPYETFNRHTFAFNDFMDRNFLKPVSKVYKKIMPKPLNEGVTNFFRNLNTLSTIADDILQLNIYQMANDSWRFAINSTIGIGGLFDVASRIHLKYYENDFGMVMAKYGWTNSNYIVIPFYGSYTIRDGLSLPVDFFLLSAYTYIKPDTLRYGLYAVSVVDYRADALTFESVLDAAAIDKYTFVRNAYMQRRAHQIKKNQQLGYKDQLSRVSSVSLDNADDASVS